MTTHKPVLIDELHGVMIPAEGQYLWQVIHTKPHCEKKLADYLKRIDITYYLPQIKNTRTYQYRKITFTKPMFPSYIFVRIKADDKITILRSGYCVRFLPVKNQQELFNELHAIYLGRSFNATITEGKWLEEGWIVEIVNGALSGIRGIVQSQTKINEVTLQVSILRQAVTMRVNPKDIVIIGRYNSGNPFRNSSIT